MSDLPPIVVLTLGGITFVDYEVPERLAGFGGEQALTIHQLPGGGRVIDVMGVSRGQLTWDGRFRGKDALSRARALEKLFEAGDQITLAVGDVRETVLIHEYHYDIERFYEVPYRIALDVVGDAEAQAAPGVQEAITSDNTAAQGLGAQIGDDQLSDFLSDLDGAISKVSNFANAAQAQISSVMAPIQQVQGRITTLIAASENTLNSVTTLGGVLPNNPISQTVSKLEGQVNAMAQAAPLYELQNTVGRMGGNLTAIGSAGAQVVMAGGDLYRLAEQSYGDATEWATIAKANGLTDPVITGVRTVVVPPAPKGVDGLLQT